MSNTKYQSVKQTEQSLLSQGWVFDYDHSLASCCYTLKKGRDKYVCIDGEWVLNPKAVLSFIL